MALDADEEILQDFLVEAGEILETLSEELVELENRPDDDDLLNAIFRGFHTVKGGAGFLQLEPLVTCCHSAENVFDTLRNHKRGVDSDLMDVVLEALDNVNSMFEEVRNREEPTPAEPRLIEALDKLAEPEGEVASGEPDDTPKASGGEEESTASGAEPTEGDITDDEFEQLLDAVGDDQPKENGAGAGAESAPGKSGAEAGGDDEISEDEFEALLDDLHGKGQFQGKPEDDPGAPDHKSDQPKDDSGSGDDLITDDEFESLLDDLHGKGKGPSVEGDEPSNKPAPKDKAPPKEEPAAASKPSPKPEKTPEEAPKPAAGGGQGGKDGGGAKGNGGGQKDPAPPTETTVRVDTRRLDDIMNMVGELVLVRNRLQRLGGEIENGEMHKAVSNLDVVTSDLQSAVMQTRMQPIKKVFGRFPRVVRDLARNLKKEINLVMHGEDTDLDKNLVEALSDPLVHLVRNSVDHGVEPPDEREKAGKPRTGRVTLSAEQEGDHIVLMIEDDGGGMDPEKLRQRAVEKGVYDQDAADRLTESECYNLIFAPGFSTKEQISDVSGRGVGMDVVKTKIGQLNGTINVESELGKGSRIVIKVPLTLAIMPTLMIMLDQQSFALPLVNVVEIFHLDLTKKNIVDGRECIVVRDKVFPLFHIKQWLVPGAQTDTEPESAHVVIVAMGTKRVGFVVDQLIGQEEVVIKPLGRMLHGTPGMAGATITGDGRIALILDVPSLLQYYG
ncbi:two-component system chemotaxis sensor kinase CheA [Tamilnaduibacter salinus]|uniref:Chemotaxis protein CheA n=1 Tax=Tamilnaduibacter salinus TaxID=1484056 RepID=A0A2A2I7T0_9GAMM|nr:chemotaxis protein CheA [Tamilnaduibacter salinus]PAV27354.1 chemotaxis protein CheA [Tamilnaduibacter salinus]PVY79273.1 two-component system chemotaxis sensor kinase CheA [Tamilnaduibacter salinus]